MIQIYATLGSIAFFLAVILSWTNVQAAIFGILIAIFLVLLAIFELLYKNYKNDEG